MLKDGIFDINLPQPSTSGNVLTSDGDNWVSQAPASSASVQAFLQCEVNSGTLVTNESSNISSVTRVSIGIYDINFSTPFANADYAILGHANISGDESLFVAIYQRTASSFRVRTRTARNSGGADANFLSIAVIN